MTDKTMPTKEGFYWAKLKIVDDGTDDEAEFTPSDEWEVVQVFANHQYNDEPDYLRVFVGGMRRTKSLENFFWGEEVTRAPSPVTVDELKRKVSKEVFNADFVTNAADKAVDIVLASGHLSLPAMAERGDAHDPEWFFRWIARGKAGYAGMTMQQCADMIWHSPANPYRENNPWAAPQPDAQATAGDTSNWDQDQKTLRGLEAIRKPAPAKSEAIEGLQEAMDRKYTPEEIAQWDEAYCLPLSDFEKIEKAARRYANGETTGDK